MERRAALLRPRLGAGVLAKHARLPTLHFAAFLPPGPRFLGPTQGAFLTLPDPEAFASFARAQSSH